MKKAKYFYSNGKIVRVGDVVGLDQLDGLGVIKKGRVDQILVPQSPEAKRYGCPEGGVFVCFDDEDWQLWTVLDEHLVPL